MRSEDRLAERPDRDLLSPPQAFADPERAQKLASAFPVVDRVFAAFRERHRIPGVAHGVVIDGELAHTGAVGVRDAAGADPEDPPGPDSVFRIASVTKSITAMCLLVLRDEGRLSLDDPVAGYVPQLASLRYPTLDSVPVTLRQLLTMSGGLVEDDAWADRQLGASQEALTAWLAAGVPLSAAPGVAFEYSNLGYAILGRAIANVAGVPYRRFAEERILQPLGMSSTTWDADRIPAERVAAGARLVDGEWRPEEPLPDGAFGPMGGLATSIRDFARYVAFHLSAWPPRDDPETGPLGRASVREMHQAWRSGPTFMSSDGVAGFLADGYGYGLTSGVHQRLGRVVSHSGGLPGFGSHVQWLPDHGVGVLAFANLTYAPVREAVWSAFDELADHGGLEPRVLRPSPVLASFRDAVTKLYEAWSQDDANALVADNFFLDEPAERRRRAFEELRAAHGSSVEAGELRPSGALRGGWQLRCERGAIDVSISLSPTMPPRLQTLELIPVKDSP
jgi:CubicO group peptidase (beta-lactamase class C family)